MLYAEQNVRLHKILMQINFNLLLMMYLMRNVGTQDREKLYIFFLF